MKTRILLGVLAAGLASWLTVAADERQQTTDSGQQPAAGVQDFVFLAEGRPLLVRLHVAIDGKPFQAAWDDCMKHVFESLDADKDGSLSRAEAEKAPPAPVLFGGGFFGGVPTLTPDQLDEDRDGKVTRDELGNFYRRNGGAPFQVAGGGNQNRGQYVVLSSGMGRGPSADALNESVFKLLDADKDGKLSKEELARAPASFLKLDSSDDEVVTAQELIPGPGGGDGEYAVFFDEVMTMKQGGSSVILAITPGESPTNLVRQLLARYGPKEKGKPAAKKLNRKELGLDEDAFKQLDADGDGELDSEELARYARRAPDVELAVRLGKTGGKEAAVDIVAPEGRPAPLGGGLRKSDGGVAFDLGVTRIDLRTGGAGGMAFVGVPNNKDIFKMQFGMVDQDNNGYLDMNEVKRGQGRIFASLFKLMDADGDGMLYEKEMLAYLDQTEKLQARATSACVSLSVSDQGRGLFDLLDTNRDGRLGVREMRGAVKLLADLDRDADGCLGKNEVPRSYQLTLDKGPAAGGGFGGRVVAFRADMTAPATPPRPQTGPLWFHKMDRNRDGDVARREFLGTDEQFAKVDADGDGLISAEEAGRADADFRKPKESER